MAEVMKLTDKTIDVLAEKIADMYKACGVDRKDIIKTRLLLEETLIKYKNHFGEDLELTCRIYKVFKQHRFIIRIKAPSFDPFSLEENPMAFMIESMMSSYENGMPTWKYHNLANEIIFTVKKKAKVSGIIKVGISLSVSILLSVIARMTLDGERLANFVTSYVNPLADAYAGLFCVMAVLLTFFAIVLSIVRIGDINAAGVTGGKILRRFYVMSAICAVVFSIPVLPFFQYGASDRFSIAIKSVYDVLIGFIPTNIVSPFLNFNSMHVIIVGAMFGFSLLAMGQKGTTLVKVFDECNLVSITTNDFLNKFVDGFIFLKVFTMITTSDFDTLRSVGKVAIMVVSAQLALFIFYTLYVCIRNRIPFKTYFKHMIPSFVVCLSSANFGAAFSSIVEGLVGLDCFDEKSNIALNVGGVVFRPANTLVFFISSMFMASHYGIEISVVWAITSMVLSLILVAAVPNIPSVSVSVITLFFAQLGLPTAAVEMMIAVYASIQFLTVAVDTWCLSAECVNVSYKRKSKERAKNGNSN